MIILTDSQLEYFGFKFVNEHIMEKENITFEKYIERELNKIHGK